MSEETSRQVIIENNNVFNVMKYTEICHAGTEDHDVEWERKGPLSMVFEEIIEIEGKKYEKYLLLYQYSIKNCHHPSHQEQLKMKDRKGKSYSYNHCGQSNHFEPEYKYIRIKDEE